MPPQSKQLDLSKYSPEQQQAIRQQLELSLRAGTLNPAQRASITETLRTFPTIQGAPMSMPTTASQDRFEDPTVAKTAMREVMSFLKSFPQAITGAYESATAPRTAQEKKEYPSALDYPNMVFDRMITRPVEVAEDWYTDVAKGKVPYAYEQALSVAPEAIGQGASAPVAAKLLSPKTGAAGVRALSRMGEAIANQRLLPLRELLNLSAPADEAAAMRVKIPGRNLGLEPLPPSIEELTKQAIAERRALPTKLRIQEPASAAPRKVAPPPVSGFKGPVETEPTTEATRKVSPPPVTGFKRAPDITPLEGEAEGIRGSLPKGAGRMVVTPEEAQRLQQLYNVAKKQAHERGMSFAGGQVPAGGRKVPFVPQPSVTEEFGGPRGAAEEGLEAARRRGPGDIRQTIEAQADKIRNLRTVMERQRAAGDPTAWITYQEWRAAEDQLNEMRQAAAQEWPKEYQQAPKTVSSQGGAGANYTADQLAEFKRKHGIK